MAPYRAASDALMRSSMLIDAQGARKAAGSFREGGWLLRNILRKAPIPLRHRQDKILQPRTLLDAGLWF